MPAVCATRASLITPHQLGSPGTALLGLEGGRAGDPELQSSSLLPTCSPAKGQCLYLYPLAPGRADVAGLGAPSGGCYNNVRTERSILCNAAPEGAA